MEDESQHFIGKIAQKAVIEKDGKVLVCRGIGDAVWEFPGGRLHGNEFPHEGLAREVKEELGLDIIIHKPLHVTKSHHAKSELWNIFLAYQCSISENDKLKIDPKEIEDSKWVTFEELKTLPMFSDCREAADVFLKMREV